jgi:aminodeoxyfutalosine synthase
MSKAAIEVVLNQADVHPNLQVIAQKVLAGTRITNADALELYTKGEIDFLGALANYVREQKFGNTTYYNKNFHLEPTNVCVFSCNFCSYSQLYKNREDGWELTIEEMLHRVKKYDGQDVKEIHIVGGVHPKMDLDFFCELIRQIHQHRPELHIKGFTAVELDYMFRKAKLTTEQGLTKLKEAGLQSLPGGGAEIFDETVRQQICADKVDGAGWLNIHETAHKLGMHSNATMLYGHVETYEHRIDHMDKLRTLQDKTGGFNCFIPLKFRNHDNDMSHIAESSRIEDIKVYCIARIYMDNFAHLKAYWPMLGRANAQLMLSFGVDDLDGTIDDTTKIYSMAGSEEQSPTMTTEEICDLIRAVGRTPVERDTLYNVIEEELA